MNKEEEFLLIKKVQAGEVNAFEALVNKHKQYVFSIVLNILRNNEDAEEVCMDVFIKAYQKIDSFHFDSKFSTWLYTIAYRQALMLIRKRKANFDELNDQHAADSSFIKQIHQKEQRIIIDSALDELSEEDKTIVTLYYLSELSLKEIEEVTAIKADTVKVKIHRLRKKLQHILEQQLPEIELSSLI